jgi:adenylylsulfate kinase-like enzyme
VQKHGTFLEVFAKCPIPVLSDRDPKGLYKKALAGQLPNFTGVSDPYEEPLHPEVVCETDRETVAESAGKVLGRLEQLGLVPPAGGKLQDYSPEQEAKLRKRLEDMGYLQP